MANLQAVASWHADKATQAYLSGDMVEYGRHIVICDALRRFGKPVYLTQLG